MSLIKTLEKVTGFCSPAFTSGCIEGKVCLCWIEDTSDLLTRNPMPNLHCWLVSPTLVLCIHSFGPYFFHLYWYKLDLNLFIIVITTVRSGVNRGKFSNTTFCHCQMVQHTETQPPQRVAYIYVEWLQKTTESELLLGNTYDRVFLALCKDLNK